MRAAPSQEPLPAGWMAAGMVLWALHFTAIYGFTALACSRQMEAQVPWVVVSATAVGGLATAIVVFKGWRGRTAFTGWMTAALAALALLAMLWEGLSVLGVPPCGVR